MTGYTYDKGGNRLTKTENGFTTTCVYDKNNRLIKEACPEQGRRDDVMAL